MAELPRYQRIGLKIRQPQQMDFAATREQAQLGQTITQQVNRMSDFAFKQAAQAAEVRGQERVREEGALPTLEAIQEAGGPRTIAQRAAVEAGNRIAVVEIETLAKQDMQNLVRQADKTGMSTSAFNASMANIRDGYAASMELIDPVAAGVLTARLNDSSMTYQGKYADVAFRKAQAAAKERVTEIINVNSQEIIDSATQPGSNGETIEKGISNLIKKQIELGVKEETAQKTARKVMQTAMIQNRYYLVDNAANFRVKKELLEEFKKADIPDYSYLQNRNLNDRLQNIVNGEIGRAQKKIDQDLTDAITVLENTGVPPEGFEFNPDEIKDVFSEEQAAELENAWNDSNEDVANRGSLNFMTPREVDKITEELTAEINTAADPERAIARSRAWNNAVADRNDALNKDAGLYAVRTDPAAQIAVEDIQRHLASGNVGMFAESLIMLRDLSETKFDVMKVPSNKRNIMPKALASQMVGMIKGIDTDVAAQTFNQIRLSLGDYGPRFIAELRAQNLPPEYVQAMYANKPGVQQELLQISDRDIKEIKVGIDNTVQNDLRLAMTSALEDYRMAYIAGGGEVAEDIFNEQYVVMEKLALTRIKESGISPAAAAESVIADIVPDSAQVVLSSVGKYVVPIEFNQNTIELSASNFLDEDVLKQLDLEPLDSTYDPDFVDEAISIAAIASDGMWFNNSTGDGLTLHYVINGDEIPVLTKDGKEFEVKFATMESQLKKLFEQADAPMTQAPFGGDDLGSRPEVSDPLGAAISGNLGN